MIKVVDPSSTCQDEHSCSTLLAYERAGDPSSVGALLCPTQMLAHPLPVGTLECLVALRCPRFVEEVRAGLAGVDMCLPSNRNTMRRGSRYSSLDLSTR
jgi:hypothetical protein